MAISIKQNKTDANIRVKECSTLSVNSKLICNIIVKFIQYKIN